MPKLNKFYIVFTAEKPNPPGVIGGAQQYTESIVSHYMGDLTEDALLNKLPEAIKRQEGCSKVLILNVIPLPVRGVACLE